MSAVQPFHQFAGADGLVDLFMLPFDKLGQCQGPQTRSHLVERAADPSLTDVFLFSHGWNNDWHVATGRYRDFIEGYLALRHAGGLALDRPMRAMLIGVFWPSTALVFGSERGIDIAGTTGTRYDQRQEEVDALAAELPAAERFRELVDCDELSAEEAAELVGVLGPLLERDDDDETPSSPQPHAASYIDLWRDLPSFGPATDEDPAKVAARLEDFGRATPQDDLAGALALRELDPRQIVRLVTLRVMKDRAGYVGAHGVGSFLQDLLAASAANRPKFHLIGHSFGAKVCLSAICHPAQLPRPVDSLLLLQPAVSHRCFADDELGTGGYVETPRRVLQPVLSTYSSRDKPLHVFFQYAVRREVDRDEASIAAGEPSRWAALGGFGPHGMGALAQHVAVRLPASDPSRYDLGRDAARVYGVDATSTISGHGDINNLSTHWALDNLVASSRGVPDA